MIINDLWKRLNHLVPGPNCSTFGDEYELIEWNDTRPKPSETDLTNITKVDLDVTDKELRIGGKWSSRFVKFLFLVHFNMENRMRVLEGKSKITQKQYFDALRKKASNLDSLLEV